MEDRHKLYENEREWRKYIDHKIDKLGDKIDKLGPFLLKHDRRISKIEVWNIVFRTSGFVVIGLLVAWVKIQLFHDY